MTHNFSMSHNHESLQFLCLVFFRSNFLFNNFSLDNLNQHFWRKMPLPSRPIKTRLDKWSILIGWEVLVIVWRMPKYFSKKIVKNYNFYQGYDDVGKNGRQKCPPNPRPVRVMLQAILWVSQTVSDQSSTDKIGLSSSGEMGFQFQNSFLCPWNSGLDTVHKLQILINAIHNQASSDSEDRPLFYTDVF